MTFFDWVRGTQPEEEPQPEVKKVPMVEMTTHMHIPNGLETAQANIKAPSYAMDDSDVAVDLKAAFRLSANNVPNTILGWYGSQGFIGYQMCAVMAQQWLVNKACVAPAEDAVKNGWKVTFPDEKDFDDEKILKFIEKFDKSRKVAQACRELIQMKRVYGVRIALFKVKSDDKDYYEKPFNLDGVRPYSYEGIAQIDPYWAVPELTTEDVADPASVHFYEPTYYVIGGKRYHRSHFVVVRHAELPDILKPAYFYGGASLVQQIYERAYAAERTANEAPQLTMTKRMNVMKTDISKMIADPQKFVRMKEVQTQFRDNYGTLLIGEDEEYQQHETTLADLDNIIMTQYQLVSAVANVPATRLLGTSPKGFNSTGQHELKVYHEMLASLQENDLDPLLDRHYQLMMKAYVEPEFKMKLTPKVVFNPLDVPTEKERAEIQKLKADTYATLQGTGAITAQEIAEALVKDEESGFEALDPDEVENITAEEKPDETAENGRKGG